MPNYIVLRHGETKFNVEKRHQSWVDSPLTSNGVKQIEEVGAFLKSNSIKISCIYASDLGRVRETVKILIKYIGAVPIYLTSILREHHMGDFDGKTEEEVEEISPGFNIIRGKDKWNVRPPNGENYNDTLIRVKPLLNNLNKRYSNSSTILIVTHKSMAKLIFFYLNQCDFDNFKDIKELCPGEAYFVFNG
jgi:probable phosphoglycerate mutase